MNNSKIRIEKMESKGWKYTENLRLYFNNNCVEIPQAWVKDNQYRTFENGKFSRPKTL